MRTQPRRRAHALGSSSSRQCERHLQRRYPAAVAFTRPAPVPPISLPARALSDAPPVLRQKEANVCVFFWRRARAGDWTGACGCGAAHVSPPSHPAGGPGQSWVRVGTRNTSRGRGVGPRAPEGSGARQKESSRAAAASSSLVARPRRSRLVWRTDLAYVASTRTHSSAAAAMDPYKHRPSSSFNAPYWTTNSGAPVWNNDNSLTVGARGPILLEDYHLVEKLANFDRERIPERVVHARGASAKGFFEVTHDITHLSCADFLRAPGVQTPVIVRFSTVIHERGSPETLRDPRGFAVKFYTREGNWDLVGNNFPVFFVRDGMKFPDMVHALKPNPRTHIQENWRILDFFSHHPESLHMFTFLFDDVGIPADYRHMDGSGVHTYTLINRAGKATYVKFHWRPTCGVRSLLDDEAVTVGGTNHSHATKDLYDAIAAGNFPEWKLYIQTMEPEHEDRFDFDPLDVTKTWPEDVFPMQPVGRMVLNRNIDNFFAENEQLAFCPGLIVPGIYYSDDKLLQTRIFSYSDTQRHRLGPNYLLLPANAPKCAHHNNHYDGFMNFMHRDEEVDYFPSRYDPARNAPRYPIPAVPITGRREKAVIGKENNFKQPGERYRAMDPARQERFIKRWIDALSDPRLTHEIRSIWLSYWSQADRSLGQKLASRLSSKPSM